MTAPGTVVIVGAGQAGFQAAASLRDEGFAGRVLLLGDEPGLPYQRPPLSKAYLLGKADDAAVRLRPASFFAEHGIELRPGQRVTAIARHDRRLALRDGETLAYDHLILATGSRNRALRVPGADLDGVAQLRSLAEAETLREHLTHARAIAVVGAGFIGLEVAAIAAAGDARVTVIEAQDRLMARSVSPAMAAHVQRAHERLGVAFHFEAAVTAIRGRDGRATAVETADGRVTAADLVLVGIGVVPNDELAANAGLAAGNGVAVDDHLLTADPAISAIGDCVLHPNRHAGGAPIRLESVQNAADGARCVAARLTGTPRPYASLPWFWTEQGPVKLQIAGLATPHDRAVLRGDPASGSISAFCFRGPRLVGVESANRPLDHVLARKLLANGTDLTPEQAGDPGFDLKAHANK